MVDSSAALQAFETVLFAHPDPSPSTLSFHQTKSLLIAGLTTSDIILHGCNNIMYKFALNTQRGSSRKHHRFLTAAKIVGTLQVWSRGHCCRHPPRQPAKHLHHRGAPGELKRKIESRARAVLEPRNCCVGPPSTHGPARENPCYVHRQDCVDARLSERNLGIHRSTQNVATLAICPVSWHLGGSAIRN